MNMHEHAANVAKEVDRVQALVASAPDEYVSIGAGFASLKVGGGLFAIYTGVVTPTYFVHGGIGGLAAGLDVTGGKLTVAKRINKRGYTGSCSLFTIAVLAAYTNLVGYDEHGNPVLWFNGGGVGLDLFLGGGRFEMDNPLPTPGQPPAPAKPAFVRKADIAPMLERDLRIAVPKDSSGHYWEVEDSSKNDGSRVQLWNSDAPARTWQIIPAGTDSNGHDLFRLHNVKLNTYATFWFDPVRDRIEGFPITSSGRKNAAQSFNISRDASGLFSFYVNDTAAMVREGNNSGNSTKIVTAELNANNLESGLWEFKLI